MRFLLFNGVCRSGQEPLSVFSVVSTRGKLVLFVDLEYLYKVFEIPATKYYDLFRETDHCLFSEYFVTWLLNNHANKIPSFVEKLLNTAALDALCLVIYGESPTHISYQGRCDGHLEVCGSAPNQVVKRDNRRIGVLDFEFTGSLTNLMDIYYWLVSGIGEVIPNRIVTEYQLVKFPHDGFNNLLISYATILENCPNTKTVFNTQPWVDANAQNKRVEKNSTLVLENESKEERDG